MKQVYALLLAALTAGAAHAQSDRPVRFILPNATGSGVDAITRAAQPALSRALGTSIVVDNRRAPAAWWGYRRWRAPRPTSDRAGVFYSGLKTASISRAPCSTRTTSIPLASGT